MKTEPRSACGDSEGKESTPSGCKVSVVSQVLNTPLPRSPPPSFSGNCYSCGQQGHSKKYCQQGRGSRRLGSAEEGQYRYNPCCWHCGQVHRFSGCPHSQVMAIMPDLGNGQGLGNGTGNQPAVPRLQSVRCHAAGARTVQVRVQVDGKPCDLTVDKGAECTFVQMGVTEAPNPPCSTGTTVRGNR